MLVSIVLMSSKLHLGVTVYLVSEYHWLYTGLGEAVKIINSVNGPLLHASEEDQYVVPLRHHA